MEVAMMLGLLEEVLVRNLQVSWGNFLYHLLLIEREICPKEICPVEICPAVLVLGWHVVFVFVAIVPLHVEAESRKI